MSGVDRVDPRLLREILEREAAFFVKPQPRIQSAFCALCDKDPEDCECGERNDEGAPS